MATYRKPTEKETEKLNKSREKMIEGIEGEKDMFSKMMPTMAKAARDDIRAAKAMRESVPASAREGEAYQNAGYKAGGKVSSASKRADGCAVKGKTRGRMI
jgi:rubrerythrin